MKPRILLAEDETALVALLRYNLEKEGYIVDEALDGNEALIKIKEAPPDLVLLDWMLPHVSGIEICRQLRRDPETRNLPVIMLTARAEEQDRIRGLDTGADDYLSKPFSPVELMARIRAVLRRIRPALTDEVLTCGDLVMDVVTHRVTRAGRSLKLGPTEYRLLRYFLENQTRVLSRDHLLNAIWGRDVYVEERTVDVHIRRLRKAINLDGLPDIIRTVRSAGYALDPAAEDEGLTAGSA